MDAIDSLYSKIFPERPSTGSPISRDRQDDSKSAQDDSMKMQDDSMM